MIPYHTHHFIVIIHTSFTKPTQLLVLKLHQLSKDHLSTAIQVEYLPHSHLATATATTATPPRVL
jgi:hypothetical protein